MAMIIVRATTVSLYLGCFTMFTDFTLLGLDPDALDRDGGVGSSSGDPPRLPHISYKIARELQVL